MNYYSIFSYEDRSRLALPRWQDVVVVADSWNLP